mmetsp:Transcript_121847/g.221762  ORF Transcript_121847/g.221762 Transcript_121847/m.221762 type:complete len:104 (+) Transcript_121847:2-313(+)
MDRSDPFSRLLSQMLAESSSDRKVRMKSTVCEWPADQQQRNADLLFDSINVMVVEIQTEAIAQHERGGDTTEAQRKLQALVDIMVHSKILVRNAKLERSFLKR